VILPRRVGSPPVDALAGYPWPRTTTTDELGVDTRRTEASVATYDKVHLRQ
jgi:hypothetical protein